MTPRAYDASSSVEARELPSGGSRHRSSPGEKNPVIVVENFPALGRLTALRFLEWFIKNPDGVIALPTGSMPEHFIRWVRHLTDNGGKPGIRDMFSSHGIDPVSPPEMGDLSLVQNNEFYPIDALQHNSFHHYVRGFYIGGFGLDRGKALLNDATSIGLPAGCTMRDLFPGGAVDLTLRIRHLHSDLERRQKEVINRVDEFCMEYEAKIREMGGIGPEGI